MITRKGLLLALLLISSACCFAQVSYQVILPANPPGGVGASCLATTYGYLAPVTGGSELVLCDPSTHLWTVQAGGGGSGTCPATGTANEIQTYSDSTHCASSAATADSSGNVAGASLSAGTSPPATTCGTGGCINFGEGTLPTVGKGVGNDICYADSTTHKLLCSSNNGSYLSISSNSVLCGTTTTCSATAVPTPQIVYGSAPLVSGTPSTATITGISPAFTSSSTYVCTVSAQSGATTALLSVTNVSGSSFTITGPSTSTTVINYICTGA